MLNILFFIILIFGMIAVTTMWLVLILDYIPDIIEKWRTIKNEKK